MCLVYGVDNGPFITGNSDWRHIYIRVDEHEKTRTHMSSVDAYMMFKNAASVDSLLTYG